ncbi:hypothetical protein ACE1BJ_23465, partial [Aeromonas jandaei]
FAPSLGNPSTGCGVGVNGGIPSGPATPGGCNSRASGNDKNNGKGNNSKGTKGSGGRGGGGRSRVICTHFYRKGMLDHKLWRADLDYTQKNLSATTVRGYHYWAIPYVELMRKNSAYEKIMYPIAKYRAIELAYQMGVLDKGSLRGKLVRLVIEPTCFLIGMFCAQKDWEHLWVKNS